MKTIKTSLILSCLALPLLSFAAETARLDAPPPAAQDDLAHSAAATTNVGGDSTALAKASQNPLSSMISLPFQNNTNFNVGPDNQTQNIMLVQPVIPFSLNDDWNVIQRTIMPVTTQPGFITGDGTKTGLGNTQVLAYFSPKQAINGWYFGISPVLDLPASSNHYGSKNWGYGLSGVALTMPGKWVVGLLLTQEWIPAGAGSEQVNRATFQYFVNYNLSDGWYLTSNPAMSYNKRAAAGDRFNIPVGGGVGKIVKWGKQPINLSLKAFKNVVKPNGNSADTTVQVQVQFLFPK